MLPAPRTPGTIERSADRNQQHETQLRRVSQLAPERLREQIQRHMEAPSRGDRVDGGELQQLVKEAKRLCGAASSRRVT